MLLISGQIFCGIFGLAIMVGAQIGTGRENIRKLRLPFLPFLLPASLWMVLMRINAARDSKTTERIMDASTVMLAL